MNAVAAAHAAAAAVLRPGDNAVDATAGNGHDTVFLARAVGPAGRVFAVDIQAAAIAATRARLEAEGLAGRVTLLHADHRDLARELPEELAGRVRAIMFNLGYLPGPDGDPALVTLPATSCAALEAAAGRFLEPGGVITVVTYPGHPGGVEEEEAVLAWAAALPRGDGGFATRFRRSHPGNPAAPGCVVVSSALGGERIRPRPPADPP